MIVEKAQSGDFKSRFREIISDPLNLLINRVPNAGCQKNGYVVMHNGLLMPVEGEYAYYSDFSDILILNRGVHEPLEEFVFQTLLKRVRYNTSVNMIELGAYWGHYSGWLKSVVPHSSVTLVEPDETNHISGVKNFKHNGLEGIFIKDFVGKNAFSIDEYVKNENLNNITILHSDIQGYELEMLEGAKETLASRLVDFIFVSTHSQTLHDSVEKILISSGYRIEVSSGFELHSTSFDGLVFASNSSITSLFNNFTPMGRLDINESNQYQVSNYVSSLTSLT